MAYFRGKQVPLSYIANVGATDTIRLTSETYPYTYTFAEIPLWVTITCSRYMQSGTDSYKIMNGGEVNRFYDNDQSISLIGNALTISSGDLSFYADVVAFGNFSDARAAKALQSISSGYDFFYGQSPTAGETAGESPVFDLTNISTCGVGMSSTAYKSIYQMFRNCSLFSKINMQNTGNVYNFGSAFYGCTADEVGILDYSGAKETSAAAFYNSAITKIWVVPNTICTSQDFSGADLTVESLRSIIAGLKDYSGDPEHQFTQTVTFGSTNIAKLDAATDLDVGVTGKSWLYA